MTVMAIVLVSVQYMIGMSDRPPARGRARVDVGAAGGQGDVRERLQAAA